MFEAMVAAKPGLVLDRVIGPMRYLKSEAELALTEQAEVKRVMAPRILARAST